MSVWKLLDKYLRRIRPQVLRRLYQAVIHFLERIINRVDHKGQEVVYHTQNDRPRCIDDGNIWQMEKGKNAVDNAIFLQERLPREGAEQEIHPHRKDEDEYHEAASPNAAAAQHQSQRIGQKQADGGRSQRHTQR